jgi:ATP-dependent Clp protease protease subunit
MNDNSRGAAPNNMMLLPSMPDDSIKYYRQTLHVSVHHFYMTKVIEEVDAYLDMINVLKTAEQHDTIFIYLNTPGGNLYTSIQIISAIRNSSATVVTCMEGMVASAGTLIFLAGHKHVVNANCTFMIHNYSHGVWGKGNEVALQVKHSEAYFKQLATDLYGKFLTAQEIEEVINGKDMWLSSDEVMSRLDANNASDSVAALMNALNGAQDDSNDEALLQSLLEQAQAAAAEDDEEEAAAAAPAKVKRKRPAKKAAEPAPEKTKTKRKKA